jgi:hypothetical protein
MNKLKCEQAKRIDLVEFLASLGHEPQRIRNQDYWFKSPFRDERTPSFKVNRSRNIWFDFGEGKGGDFIDFGTRYFNCSVSTLLDQLLNSPLSFHPHNLTGNKNQPHSSIPVAPAGEIKDPDFGKILILAERPLASAFLLNYLEKRCIPADVARRFCREIDFKLYYKEYTAIGFQNSKGGFELRNEYFKGSSSPKTSTFYDHGADMVTVFEGFFDFLSFQVLKRDDETLKTNFLVLNSLSFFHRSRSIMDKHQSVCLCLNRDKKGIEFTEQALNWDNKKYKDCCKSLKPGQDLNGWLIDYNTSLSKELLTKETTNQQKISRGL